MNEEEAEPPFEYDEEEEEEPDPDELLEIIRGLVQTWVKAGGLSSEETACLVQAVDQLDDQMSAGCVLPARWWRQAAHAHGESVPPGVQTVDPGGYLLP
jgi:hypothetical protein